MTDAVVPAQLTADEARAITEEIRSHVEAAWDAIVRAYVGRAWRALTYPSWDAYVAAEFDSNRFRLPREDLDGAIVSLRKAGLSTRAIGTATGTSAATVSRRLATVAHETVAVLPASVVSIDGRTRPASVPERVPPAIEATVRTPEPADDFIKPVVSMVTRTGAKGAQLVERLANMAEAIAHLNDRDLPRPLLATLATSTDKEVATKWCQSLTRGARALDSMALQIQEAADDHPAPPR